MSQFILTGAPGAGKTSVLRCLARLGHAVVEEAATDVNAWALARGVTQPHLEVDFLEQILSLQEVRRRAVTEVGAGPVFHDRSPICTLALAEYLDSPAPPTLASAVEALRRENYYERRVFFLRNLGFIINTDVRRISFEDTLRFERVHEATYRRCGYDLVFIEPAEVEARARTILSLAIA